ncbi:Gfo/Idh/MocA family oxidoreductase [soil metagenome]
MAIDLTTEQKEIGRNNFAVAAGDLSRRGFMKSMVAGAAVVPVSAAVYYGYSNWKGSKAVKTALIGAGDEGGVLIGDHNPAFNEIVAVCDLRPSNLDRIFEGEKQGPRKGLNLKYGKDTAKGIARYDNVKTMLADAKKLGLEAVIIATPLNTHDVITKLCMDAGLHVFCEKLMARDITKCKGMTRYAKDKSLLLGVGHQRHYSTLYAHALEVVNSGVLGDIKHIKAQWPRNNSWLYAASEEEKKKFAPQYPLPYYNDGWCKPILKEDADFLTPEKAKEWGFRDIEQLVRWRLYDSTGGGLMAELGSHQLDASSIFLGHVHPIAVQGVGGKFFYGPGRNDRESDDGVFVNYEFPGPNHPKAGKGGKDSSDVVVVSYTSFNTNEFEKYGECLCGSKGTMIVEMESDVYLFREKDKTKKADTGGRDTKISVTGEDKKKPAMEASSTWGAGGPAVVKAPGAAAWDTPVRGYQTELEHFAFCVRQWDKAKGWAKNSDGKFEQAVPNCHGEVAMADAILALTANMAMKNKARIEFEDNWFKTESEDVPETKWAPKTA